MGHSTMLEMEDFTATCGWIAVAYEMAGLSAVDMEMAMIYDSFTVTAAITAEMLGLAPKEKGISCGKTVMPLRVVACQSTPMAVACHLITPACMACIC